VPEGDVVWYTARQLHEALAGRVLTRSDFRVPRYATASLAGQVVTEAVAHGKHLLIRTSGGLTVHTHLKMDGFWRVRPAGTPLGDAHKVRLILANDKWQAAGYLLGITELLPASAEHRVTGHLGPDLLGPDWDPDEAARRILAQPGRPIGEALLALVTLAHRLLDANKARIGHVTTGMTGRGMETWVYGRRGAPCRRCGTPIRKHAGTAGEDRITFWCPNCQK
jgi:endonuclease-8